MRRTTLLCLPALLLVGCGGGEEADDAAGGEQSAATAAAATSAGVAEVFDFYGPQMDVLIQGECNSSPPSPCSTHLTELFTFTDSILDRLEDKPDDDVKTEVVELLEASQGRGSAYGTQNCFDSAIVRADPELSQSCSDLVVQAQDAFESARDLMATAGGN